MRGHHHVSMEDAAAKVYLALSGTNNSALMVTADN